MSQYIVHYGLGGLFDVRKAGFHAALDAAHGGKVRLWADVEFLGEPQHAEFDLDFGDPLSSVENLVEELLAA